MASSLLSKVKCGRVNGAPLPFTALMGVPRTQVS